MVLDMLQANNPFLVIIAGLMIGLAHAFDADHISAVSTQLLKNNNGSSSNSTKRHLRNLTTSASLKGALWGMGHTSSIMLIVLLIVGLSLNISDNFFVSAEIVVGLMLIVLGVFAFTNKSIFKHNHPHKHSDDGILHAHPHSHNEDHKHGHKAYVIGCIHGLAGSGSLVALAASTMNGFDMIIYFLILFGIGSMIGMGVASGVLGLSFILLSKIILAAKYMRYAVSGISFVIGVNIIFSIGLNNKLFV